MHDIDILGHPVPKRLTREGRIELIIAAARAIQQGEPIPADAAAFLGSALLAWLERGGRLERDHLRVTGQRGSHLNPQAVAKRIQEIGSPHRDE